MGPMENSSGKFYFFPRVHAKDMRYTGELRGAELSDACFLHGVCS